MALPTLIYIAGQRTSVFQLFSRNTRPRHSNRGAAAAGAGAAARALRLRREQTPSTEMLSCRLLWSVVPCPLPPLPPAVAALGRQPQQPTDAPTTTAPLLSTARLLLSWTRYSIPLRANVVTHTRNRGRRGHYTAQDRPHRAWAVGRLPLGGRRWRWGRARVFSARVHLALYFGHIVMFMYGPQ